MIQKKIEIEAEVAVEDTWKSFDLDKSPNIDRRNCDNPRNTR